MAKLPVYNFEGKKVEDIELSPVFEVKSNNDLVHQVYVAIAANKRTVLSHAKDMSEVAGSGKKPWRQKGTGSARVGSVRNPIWKGGGVVFGPTKDRNFKKDINRKMKQKALQVAFADKVKSNNVVLVDKIDLKEKKTKLFAEALKNLNIKGTALIGFDEKERELRIASRNIEKVDNILARNLNVYDILNHKYLILSKDSLKYLEEKFSK